MLRQKKVLLLLLGGITLLVLGGISWYKDFSKVVSSKASKVESVQTSPTPISSDPRSLAKVSRVIDGDTIELSNGEKVRYIGIDAPETVDPRKPVQCFGKEASQKNRKLVEGQMVGLEKDISERDKYGRLLRFVYVGDLFVNDYLVRQGFAKAFTYPPDVKYSSQFVKAEKEARENNRGLWGKCSQTLSTSPSSSPKPENLNLDSKINCSSNTYNCSSFKTQAEAQNIFDYCMQAVGYDVHKLDRDGDGRVCETLP